MAFHLTRRFLTALVGALLGCIMLFLLSGLPSPPAFACCGKGMGFPFFCFFLFLAFFNLGASLLLLVPRQSALFAWCIAAGRRFQPFVTLLLSTEIRAWFVFSLFLFSILMAMGAGLLFSLSLGFDWSALVLGCLSLFLGFGVLFLGLRHTRYPRRG